MSDTEFVGWLIVAVIFLAASVSGVSSLLKLIFLVVIATIAYDKTGLIGALIAIAVLLLLFVSTIKKAPPKVENSKAALRLKRKTEEAKRKLDEERKKQWRYSTDGKKEYGPVSFIKMQELARKGKIDGDTLVYHPGLENWTPASETGVLSTNSEISISSTTDSVVTVGSGSGFLVANSYVVTNQHVVDGCREILVKNKLFESNADIVSTDKSNDFALLKLRSATNLSHASLRSADVDLGEDVIVVGYPMRDFLGEGLKATTGNISGTTGVANDTRMFQVTAPIQAGNSGGPLLDKSGNVVGVVSSSLNEGMIASLTGSLPQNVNFAIKASMLDIFLNNARLAPNYGDNDLNLKNKSVVKKAEEFTVMVVCKG